MKTIRLQGVIATLTAFALAASSLVVGVDVAEAAADAPTTSNPPTLAIPSRDLRYADSDSVYVEVLRRTPIYRRSNATSDKVAYLEKNAVVRIYSASYNVNQVGSAGNLVNLDDDYLDYGTYSYDGYLLSDDIRIFAGLISLKSAGSQMHRSSNIGKVSVGARTIQDEDRWQYVVTKKDALARCNSRNCNGTRTEFGGILPKGSVVKIYGANYNVSAASTPGEWVKTDDSRLESLLNNTTIYLLSDDLIPYSRWLKERYLGDATWSKATIGTGWASKKYTHVFNAGDLDRNGYEDMMLTDRNGTLWFYPMKSNTDFKARQKVGYGWNGMKKIFGGVDFNGDGRVDILGISNSGVLYYYPGLGTGQFGSKVYVGGGWGNVTNISATQSGFNGKPVIMGSKSGVLYAWQTNGRGNISSTKKYGSGWDAVKLTAITRDVNGDNRPDMWVVWKNGTLSLYTATDSQGSNFKRSDVGSGWGTVRYFLPRMNNAKVIRAIFPDGYLRQYTLKSFTPSR